MPDANSTNPIPVPGSADVPALMRERFDLEPQPTAQDVIEGVAAALEAAVELATPLETSARCLTLLTRVKAAADSHLTPDELLASLRRLTAGWHS